MSFPHPPAVFPRLQRYLIRPLVSINPHPDPPRQAIRSASAMAAGIIATSLILGPQAGSVGTMGALSADVGHESPMRRRLVTLLLVGLSTFACEALGIWMGTHPLLIPPLMTGVTLVVVWTWHALLLGVPGPINIVFSTAFGIYMGANGWGVWEILQPTMLAWAVSGTVTIGLLALHPHEPEFDALEYARLSLHRYLSLPAHADDTERGIARSRACIAVNSAWQVLRAGRRRPDAHPLTQVGRDLALELSYVHRQLMLALDRDSFPVTALTMKGMTRVTPDRRPRWTYLLRTALLRGSRPSLVASRAALAVLLATSTMYVVPFGRPYWAILSAIIVLHMGASRADLTIRAYHRVAGTLLGVVVYVGIVAFDPSMWVRVGIVILAVYAMEILVTRNYAACVVFVTVFALIMFRVVNTYELSTLLLDRLGETAVGVACALVAIWLVGLRAPVLLVRRQYRMTLERIVAVLDDMRTQDLTSAQAHEHRQLLIFELGRAAAVLSSASEDDPHRTYRWMEVARGVNRLGLAVVTACWREPGSTTIAAGQAYDALTRVIAALPPISTTNIDVAPIVAEIESITDDFSVTAVQPPHPSPKQPE